MTHKYYFIVYVLENIYKYKLNMYVGIFYQSVDVNFTQFNPFKQILVLHVTEYEHFNQH